jgi:hypothetical protein
MGLTRMEMNNRENEDKRQNSFIMKVLKGFAIAPFLGLKMIDKAFSI